MADLTHLIDSVRQQIDAFDPGTELERIGVKQTYVGALFAIWMSHQYGYCEMPDIRPGDDEDRERSIYEEYLRVIARNRYPQQDDRLGEFYFNSAGMRVAAATHCTFKYYFKPLAGREACRSQPNLEHMAVDHGLISAGDRALLQRTRLDINAYKHSLGRKRWRDVRSLKELLWGLRAVVGVAHRFPQLPAADSARG